MPEGIRGSLRYPGTVADITKHSNLVSDILNLNFRNKDQLNSLRTEAEQVLRDLLKSDNIENRLRAVEIIFKN